MWGIIIFTVVFIGTMYLLWAVISGREYCGEDFNSLKLFTNLDDAQKYNQELNDQMDSECYTIIDRVFVDHGVEPEDNMLGLPEDWDPGKNQIIITP